MARKRVRKARPLTMPAAAPVTIVEPSDTLHDRVTAAISHRAFPYVALGGLFVISVGVDTTVNRHLIPNLFPDEMLYGRQSQNFAWGNGLTWRGTNSGLPPLWPIVLSVSWHFGSVLDGYSVARWLDAALA